MNLKTMNVLIHLIPERNDLGIGGCWNLGVHHPLCGKFAVQLDSDDVSCPRRYFAGHGQCILRTKLCYGSRHLYDDGLQHEHDCSGHHRPQGMDSGKRTQQRPPHQRPGCPTRLLYPGAARSESTQYQLWRRLCTGTELLPPVPDRTRVRRGLPLPPLGRQFRRLTGYCKK